jgi:hypothetical protein
VTAESEKSFRTCVAIGNKGQKKVMAEILGPRFADVFVIGGGQLSLDAEVALGDILFTRRPGVRLTMEVKTEERHTGNLFLEVWSNRKTGRPGWMETCRSDVIGLLFLDREVCYVYDFARLREWANGPSHWKRHDGFSPSRRLDDFPLKPQGKYVQDNDTWGRCVPISTKDLPLRATFIDGERVESQPGLFDYEKSIL